jgi:hypothetical protein
MPVLAKCTTVEQWEEANPVSAMDCEDRLICCVPYHCTQKIAECEKRRGSTNVYYSSLRYKDKDEDEYEYHRTPKPMFMNCVKCVVWSYLDAQVEEDANV